MCSLGATFYAMRPGCSSVRGWWLVVGGSRLNLAVQVSVLAPDVNRGTVMAWVQLLLLVLVTIALPGCEVVGGIFKAGAWAGALAVILVIAIVGILAAKIRG